MGVVGGLGLDVVGKLGLRLAEVVLLEVAVPEVVVGQRVGRGGGLQVEAVVFHGFGIISFAVEALGEPQIGIGLGFPVVVAEKGGLGEVVGRFFQVVVGEAFGSQPVEDTLFGGVDFGGGVLYLVDGVEGALVVAGGHVDVDEVVVDGVGMARPGEEVEEFLKDGDRLGKGREGGGVQREGVVVEGCLLHLRVVVVA